MLLGLKSEAMDVMKLVLSRCPDRKSNPLESPVLIPQERVASLQTAFDTFLAGTSHYVDIDYNAELPASTWFIEKCPHPESSFRCTKDFID